MKTPVLTRRRVIVAIVVLLLAAAAYTAWLIYVTQRDLRGAEAGARELRAAIAAEDDERAQEALDYLQESADSARSSTDGLWWSALTVTPVFGDDLAGVRALSASLDEVAGDAAPALLDLTEDADGLVTNGQVDLGRLQSAAGGLKTADASVQDALAEVDDRDSRDYVGFLRHRFDDYVDLLSGAARDVRAARTATEVAPTMLGADGPRDYLLIFQNNAEIRSTGGLSGSWARIHTVDGRLELKEQGSASDFEVASKPVSPVSKEEEAVYGDVIARYFQDPVMVPDFPRAAKLFDGFWKTKYPRVDLDGVLSLDTVGLSYLLRSTGPVTTDGYTLTPDSVVKTMLNQVYVDERDPLKQDEIFTRAAAAIFAAVTSDIGSPTELVKAIDQAAGERRLLVASFEDDLEARLRGTPVAGELSGDDGATPHVDITVNDATGSKMSYYLDYDAKVRATSCADDVQQFEGSMRIRQNISGKAARALPKYITGGGRFGVAVGSQQVQIRIYAPYGGKLGPVFVDDVEVPDFTVATIGGRQVITLTVVTDGTQDVPIRWTMTSAPGQTSTGKLAVTPKVTPGRSDTSIAATC